MTYTNLELALTKAFKKTAMEVDGVDVDQLFKQPKPKTMKLNPYQKLKIRVAAQKANLDYKMCEDRVIGGKVTIAELRSGILGVKLS